MTASVHFCHDTVNVRLVGSEYADLAVGGCCWLPWAREVDLACTYGVPVGNKTHHWRVLIER